MEQTIKTKTEEQTLKMKRLAVEMLKALDVHENVIQDFEQGIINCSVHAGILFWLDDEAKDAVSKFQNETGYLVYHVITNVTEIGTMLTFLYVSTHEEEWDKDLNDLKNMQEYSTGERGFTVYAYVENLTYPDCSAFGSVVIRPNIGGVIRLY